MMASAQTSNSTITVAYMNIRGQTGLDESKEVQIEKLVQGGRAVKT